MQDRPDHPRRKWALARRRRRVRAQRVEPDGPVRDALRRHLPAHHVHHPRPPLPEDLWPHRRGSGLGGRDPARVGGQEPPLQLQGPDQCRRRPELSHDRLAVPDADVLSGHRRRRRPDPHQRRPRQGFPEQAGAHHRHGRERRDADGQPDGGLQHLQGLPGFRQEGLRRGRHQAQRRRSPDDLRRLRPPAPLRPRGSRLLQARRSRRLHP